MTRSDFLADKVKPHRAPGKGMGNWRYYMAPTSLIRPHELPEGWGLIEVNSRQQTKVIAGAAARFRSGGYQDIRDDMESWLQGSDHEREMWLMVRLLSRLGDVEKANQERRDMFRAQDNLRKIIDNQHERIQVMARDLGRLRAAALSSMPRSHEDA